jgi:hypothetical protein
MEKIQRRRPIHLPNRRKTGFRQRDLHQIDAAHHGQHRHWRVAVLRKRQIGD